MPELQNAALYKLKRLAAMSPAEIAFRLRGRGRSEIEHIGLHQAPELPGSGNFQSYLAGMPTRRFYPSHSDSVRRLVQNTFPHWIDRTIEDADKLCRHEVPLLQMGTVHQGSGINWHRDPVTGQVWERRFWADYRPESDPAGRDPKIIHELNRHQHLPRLAKAYWLTGDERYAAEAVDQMLSWTEQNPPGMGINWQSSLEIAIRTISWLWTLFPILGSKALDGAAAERIGASLFAQLDHVHRHTSLYGSPNTHLLGEATALFIGGLVFRDWEPCLAWLETGAALLTREADSQFLSDGAHGELSSCYHCYALDFYLQALVLGQHNLCYFSEAVHEKIEAGLHFVMHLSRPDGTIPLLGDDDGGRALALASRDYRSFNDGLCSGAVLFQRKDFKHQCGGFAEETLWMLGEDGWNAYCQLESHAPADTRLFCPSAGYYLHRSGWGKLDSHLIFDCGGLGMLTGGHSHADSLSVVLFSGGREFLVDPGTFVYNGAPHWRRYFRSTPAHNTVTIDGRDQAEMGGSFRWNNRIAAQVTNVRSLPVPYVEAEHHGYRDVIHRRRIVNVQPGYWILLDDFRGTGEHTFDFAFHFGPEVETSSFTHDGPGLTIWSKQSGLLAMSASATLDATLARGELAPIGGWTSDGYGGKKPSSSLRASFISGVPASVMTLLAPLPKRPVVQRLRVDEGNGIALACADGGVRHIAVFCADGGAVSVAGFRMRGEFFWITMQDAVITNRVAIRASELRLGETDLLKDELCAQFAAS